jgi:hypothetical protein
VSYAETDELFRVLKVRNPTADQTAAGQRVLDAAAAEIDAELDLTTPYDPVGTVGGTNPAPPLVVEVNLERAVEHWRQQEAPFGVLGFDSTMPTPTATDSFNRHANKLAPLKANWGLS